MERQRVLRGSISSRLPRKSRSSSKLTETLNERGGDTLGDNSDLPADDEHDDRATVIPTGYRGDGGFFDPPVRGHLDRNAAHRSGDLEEMEGGEITMMQEPETHNLQSSTGQRVAVRFYPNGDIRMLVKKGAPMTMAQFWATGNGLDVIVLLKP
jgi:hypothetical protein